jgi:hypothetical protein
MQIKKMDEQEKLKNLKDLEFNKTLNHQNIWLVLIGTAMLTLLLQESIPLDLDRRQVFTVLILILFFILWLYSGKLEKISDDIKKI